MDGKTYLVVGASGEYSDYSDWIVAAYTTEEQANHHVELLSKEVPKNDSEVSEWDKLHDWDKSFSEFTTDLDPNCSPSYNGVTYWIEEVTEYRHPDEFLENPPEKSGRLIDGFYKMREKK